MAYYLCLADVRLYGVMPFFGFISAMWNADNFVLYLNSAHRVYFLRRLPLHFKRPSYTHTYTHTQTHTYIYIYIYSHIYISMVSLSLSLSLWHTHTHTHTYIYIYSKVKRITLKMRSERDILYQIDKTGWRK